MIKNKGLLFLLILFTLTYSSCKREELLPTWETDIVAPIVYTSLSIDDLITDSLVQENTDSSLTIVYQQPLCSLAIDSLLEIPDTSDNYVANLDTISVGEISIVDSMSLGELAQGLPAAQQSLIYGLHGSSFPLPISYSGLTFEQSLDFSSMFETVTLSEGILDIELTNETPFDISNIAIDVKNESDGSLIGSSSITSVPAGTSAADSIILDGKTIESSVVVDVANMDVFAPAFAPIDTSDVIIFTVTQRELEIESATAIFPAQSVINVEQETVLKLDQLWLNNVEVQSGNFVIDVYNTLNETLYLDYLIPNSGNGSNAFEVNMVIPPNSQVLGAAYPLDGYWLDLTGQDGSKENTMFHSLIGRIEYTGDTATLSKTDSVVVNYALVDIIPEKANGYIWNKIYPFGPETIDLDIFDNLKESPINSLQLDSVNFYVEIENELGFALELDVSDITASNSHTGASHSASINSGTISAPVDAYPVTPTVTNITFPNSDGKGLMETIPDQISYTVDVITNPSPPIAVPSPTNSGTDFVYYGTSVQANLNLEVPLELISSGLILLDTVEFELEESESLSSIDNGSFKILVDNGFPIESNIQIYLIDSSNTIIDSLFAAEELIAAGQLDMTSKKVTASTRSELLAPLTTSKIDNLYLTRNMIINIDFTTSPSATYHKIYNDYGIDVKVIGDFTYTIEDF